MIRERKKGEKFFRFEFMESGKRICGTLNGKKDCRLRHRNSGLVTESQRFIKVRAQLLDGTFGKEIGLEDFGTFFDKVFRSYAKEHKASW